MYRSYGDPRTPQGRALLAERSPIHKVDRIEKPMLIFHGANDVRCKIAESDTIVAAMQAKGIPVTYVVYPDEGHGFQKPPNRLSYIAIGEACFAHHLGGACEPIGRDFEGSSHEVRAVQRYSRKLGRSGTSPSYTLAASERAPGAEVRLFFCAERPASSSLS